MSSAEVRLSRSSQKYIGSVDPYALKIPAPKGRNTHYRWNATSPLHAEPEHDNFDFTFNPKLNRSMVFDLATGAFIDRREDALFLGPGGTGKSHLAQAIGQAAILQGHKVLYRETHILLEEVAEAVLDGTRKQFMESISSVALLIIDDFGMRKLPQTAAEDLLEIVMRRYERASTLLTSNRPVDDWGKLLADVAAVGAMLDRLLHHGHVLKCGPKSWRTKTAVAD